MYKSLIIFIIFSPLLVAKEFKTGSFSITDQAVPRAYYEEIQKRWKGYSPEIAKGERIPIENAKGKKFYEITWDVNVPDHYDPNTPPGILIYITPGSPRAFKSIIDKHNLILVAARNSSNDTYSFGRIAMAIWGVDQIKERYEIDENRIFVSGFSGGGRISSICAALYPEIFKGAIYQCGVNYWDNHIYDGFMHGHKPDNLKMMRENYFCFLTGDKDFNLADTKSVLKKYNESKVDKTLLIVQKEHGHKTLPSDVLDRCLTFLDTPKKERAHVYFNNGLSAMKKKKFSEAFKNMKLASASGHDEAKLKLDSMMLKFNDMKNKIALLHKDNDYVGAAKLIPSFVATYGKELCTEELEILSRYKQNPEVIKEFKADAYLRKIKLALNKKGTSKEKISAGLNKIITQCPNTKTAARAQLILNSL